MRKSVLGILAGAAALTLLVSGRGQLSEEKASEIEQAKASEARFFTDVQQGVVEPAAFPKEGEMVTIEEKEVPLSAGNDQIKEAETVIIEEEAVPLAAAKEPQAAAKESQAAAKEPQAAAKEPLTVTDDRLSDLGDGIYGYYDEEAAAMLFSQVNLLRKETKDGKGETVPALSEGLDETAKARALSCIKDFSHNGMQTAAECMAVGQKDAASVVVSWYASDLHRSYISDPAYTQGGTACIRYENGKGELQTVWVLVMN